MNDEFARLNLYRNHWGQLVLVLPDGSERAGIEPVRCFPLSDPDRSISLVDEDGHELVNLPSLDLMNPQAREVIRNELKSREFMPVIRRIIATSSPNPPCQWEIESDRGNTRFQLESEDDIRRLGAGAVIADSNGIRYRIPEIDRLDAHSQRIIRRLI